MYVSLLTNEHVIMYECEYPIWNVVIPAKNGHPQKKSEKSHFSPFFFHIHTPPTVEQEWDMGHGTVMKGQPGTGVFS